MRVEEFRRQLSEDYRGAMVRLATLRADGKHYLLFGWVELFPQDMSLPQRWTAADRPWPVPGHSSWTCGFSAIPLDVVEALSWYESAGVGQINIGSAQVMPPDFGQEPKYTQFCTSVEAPFLFPWHDNPRIHRHVSLSENPEPVRELGTVPQAREWLETHLGFDPYKYDEWLGSIALVAPDPLCSSFSVSPSARSSVGAEILTILATPRRSESAGIANLSTLSIHLSEHRVGGRGKTWTFDLNETGYATLQSDQPFHEISYVVICKKRGVLRTEAPFSWMEQISVNMNMTHKKLRVGVPSGGRRKPEKTVEVAKFTQGPNVVVGEPLQHEVRQRLVHLRTRREAREARAVAPQKIFGIARDPKDVPESEFIERRKEAEDFIASLIFNAKKRVIFVDPYFGQREMRLFAMRVAADAVTPQILTSEDVWGEKESSKSVAEVFVQDLDDIARQGAVTPRVRVMPSLLGNAMVHDRYLIVDGDVWHCGPSFNELGTRLGTIVKLPNPIAIRQIISKIWCRSSPIAEFVRNNSWPSS